MKKCSVAITIEFEVEYDPKSPEFTASMEVYSSMIQAGAEEEDMISAACLHVYKRGADDMAEGIGYMSVRGKRVGDADEYSGINILDDDPLEEFSIYHHSQDEEE